MSATRHARRTGDVLDQFRTLPIRPLIELAPGTALILAPHPDDETLGCGGLIAALCAAGRPPIVVCVTDGAASHPGSAAYPPSRLTALRAAELRAACAILGLPANRIHHLGLPDTAAPLSGKNFEHTAQTIAAIAGTHGAGTLFATWPYDPHCDHEAVAAIAARAAELSGTRLIHYPVWGWLLPPGQPFAARLPTGARLDIAAHLPAKRRAIAAHASQYTDLVTDSPQGFRLPPALLAVFDQPFETFPRPMTNSLPPAYFEHLYATDADPWRFATSDYERAKYDATLAALPRPRFPAALEIGCSIGVLTCRLAEHCDTLLAIDVADAALVQARARCANQPQVTFRRMQIPHEWPEGRFDLILFSEVLYYLSPTDLAAAAAKTKSSLAPSGAALLVHYTDPTNYPLTGDDAAERFIAATGLRVSLQRREAQYRLDLLQA